MNQARERIENAAILLAIVVLIALDQWWFDPQGLKLLRFVNLAALGVLIVITYLRVERIPRPFRPPRPSLGRAMGVILLATLVEAALLIASAWISGTLEQDYTLRALGKSQGELPLWFLGKIGTVFAQQVLLLLLVFPLCFQVTGSRWSAALIGSVLFGLMHGPNPFLAAASFLTGPVWFWLFLYSGRLLPLVASHLVLVILVRFALPSHVHLNLKTGAKALPMLRTSCWLYTHGFFPVLSQYGSKTYYDQQGGTDESFVSGLYRDLLCRKAKEREDENAWWRNLLISQSRTEVVIGFLTSREYVQKNNLPPP